MDTPSYRLDLQSLECAGSHQRNGTSPVCISCMVLKIQLLIHAFQKVVAPCFCELGPHESRKNNCILRTMQLIQMWLVALRWWEPTHSNDINIVGLICSLGCPQWNFTVWTLGERPTQHFSNILQHSRQLWRQISGVQQQGIVASQWCKNLAARCLRFTLIAPPPHPT